MPVWLKKLLGLPVTVLYFQPAAGRHIKYGELVLAEEWLGELNHQTQQQRTKFVDLCSHMLTQTQMQDIIHAELFEVGAVQEVATQRWFLGIPLH